MKPKAYSYIRFSTPEQEKGDSLRRQMEGAEKYASKNKLDLDKSLQVDRGISAYKGLNKTKGALGEFLSYIKQSKIKVGSYLIVESLDRLSREDVWEAFELFKKIIDAGIIIVTLEDQQEYEKESIKKNPTQLIISITYMIRSNRESELKSKRLKARWEQKRMNLSEKKLTSKIPKWLRKKSETEFEIIPEAKNAINEIYKLKLAGIGAGKIEKILNTNKQMWKPPKWDRNESGGWRKSYINKILNDRSVIGEFQPHKLSKEDGKYREPIGPPIENYYPPIINEDLFYQVQGVIKQNRLKAGNGGGRTGKLKNLFTYLVKCRMCGAAMHFVDKGKPPKGCRYLHCYNSIRKVTDEKSGKLVCNAKAVRYDEFERAVLTDLYELDLSKFQPDRGKIELELDNLNAQKSALIEKQKQNETAIAKAYQDWQKEKDESIRTLLRKDLKSRNEAQKLNKEDIENLERRIDQKNNEIKDQKERIDNVKEYWKLLDQTEGEQEQIVLRAKLRSEIQRIVKKNSCDTINGRSDNSAKGKAKNIYSC
jgi:DNA invertase Pin-like site-specific DNA recombinase